LPAYSQGEFFMLHRIIIGSLSIILLATVSLAQNPPQKPAEHWRYYIVFRHINVLNQKAADAERKGENSSKFRQHYKNYAALSTLQASQLNQIAIDCLSEIAPLNERIRQMVAESRAKIPGGKLLPGQPLPQSTPALKEVDSEREAVIRRHYMKLRETYGEAEFKRFNEVIEKSVRLTFTPTGARGSGPRKPPVTIEGSTKQR
jgi:hypothetical protein